MMDEELQMTPVGDHIIARLTGDIDMVNSSKLTSALIDKTPATAAGLVVDLTDVRYIDSSGLRMLFSVIKRLNDRRQSVAIAAPSGSAARAVLRVASVGQAAPVFDSPERCITALRGDEQGAF